MQTSRRTYLFAVHTLLIEPYLLFPLLLLPLPLRLPLLLLLLLLLLLSMKHYFKKKKYVRTDKYPLKSLLFDGLELPELMSAFPPKGSWATVIVIR